MNKYIILFEFFFSNITISKQGNIRNILMISETILFLDDSP